MGKLFCENFYIEIDDNLIETIDNNTNKYMKIYYKGNNDLEVKIEGKDYIVKGIDVLL